MKKVLVPTDFSANSKAGLRFALQWSTRQKLELEFVHILYILRPTSWTDNYFQKYVNQEIRIYKEKLEKFVDGICKSLNIKPAEYSCKVIEGYSAVLMIMDYCRKNPDIDFICISTRGAGKFKRIFGTNTGTLITKSQVPVIAVPRHYRIKPVKSLLYATDFCNYKEELKQVISFARPLKASVEVLHFTWPGEVLLDKKLIETAFSREFKYGLTMHFEKPDIIHSFVQRLQKEIQASKPDVAIMFTDQDRTIFQRIFLSSKSEQLSFQTRVPLLVFNKIKTA